MTAEAISAARALLLPPLQELAEQRFALALARRRAARAGARQEGLEIAVQVAVARHFLALVLLQGLFGHGKPRPPGDRGRQVYVAPLGMIRRLLELAPVGKQALGEALDAAEAVAALRPVVDREHGRHRDRVNPAVLRDEIRIVLRGQLAQRVVVGELLGERDRQELQAGIGRDIGEESDRLSDYA